MKPENKETDEGRNSRRNWAVITSLALGLPSTIFGVAYVLYLLTENQLISKAVAFVILLCVVGNIFYLMFYYASRKKN